MPSRLDAPAAVRTGASYQFGSCAAARDSYYPTEIGFSGPRGARFLRDFTFVFSEEHKEHGTLSLYTVTVRVIMDHMLNRLWVIACVRADWHRISVDHRPAHPAGHQDTS
jgi:hypothetical protein